ncbi:MAG: hypothetical protein IKL10_00260 [Clostridia bacterium]|nr:hypothetical protein [Clostridia bacterium]
MSEHNPFSKYFNKPGNSDGSEREDIIPVSDPFMALSETDNTEKEEKPEKTIAEEENKDTDSVRTARFIKTNDTPFISTKGDTEPEVPTTARKYTDRLLPNIPEKKAHTGYTGKINTYAANHSPSPLTQKFIPIGDAEKKEVREASSKTQTPEKTAEPQTRIAPSIIETASEEEGEPKVIVEKLPENKVSDKTKHIASKGDLLREIAKSSGSSSEDIPEDDEDQLMMEGFSEEDVSDEVISNDEEIEKELSEVREKRIKNFRFWTKSAVITGETEDESFSAPKEEKKLPSFLDTLSRKFAHLNTDFTPTGSDEYQDPSRRREIFSRLIEVRKSVIFKTFAVGLLGLILLIINIATMVSATLNNGFFAVFGGSAVAYNAVNLAILIICGILMLDDLKKGLFSVLKIRPKTDSALLFIYMGALLQNIFAFFTVLKPESDYHMLSGAAVILCIPVLIAKIFYYDSTRHCFKAVAATSDKSYLRKISDPALIAALLKDSSNTETNVVYTGKTRFISGFLKRSAAAAFGGQSSSRIVALTMAISVISGIIGLILTKSPVYALGCLTATAAFSFPVSCLVFTGYMLRNENSVLSVKSSFVESFTDAHSFCCIDDIILDGSDIFSAEIISSVCSSNVAQKQAEFCAAVLTHKAEGMLKNAFAGFAQGLQDRFPEVEGLVFEDKLGLSAWISDCKVLLGTKDFLISHNVELPKENTVPFVLEENAKPLFLAIEGHFAAVFSVKYSCNPIAAKSLCELAKNGTNILISVTDPNITEEFGEILLGLPENSLRIIKSTTNEKFTAQKNTVTDSEDTGIVFSDSFDAFSRTMASAIKLDKIKRVSKSLCEAVAVAGAVFSLILALAGAKTGINSIFPVILQIFWILISFVVTPMLSAAALKEKIKIPENMVTRIRTSPENEDEEAFNEPVSSQEEEPVQEKTEENEFPPAPIFSENSPADFSEKDVQLVMEGAPYTEPPEVIDFTKITGEEDIPEENTEKTVSDDILDAFAGGSTKQSRKRKSTFDETDSSAPVSFIGKLGFSSKKKNSLRRKDEEDINENNTSETSLFSAFEDKMPAPPKYDLSKKDNKEEDPLSVSFVPPENDSPSAVYTDSFFASYNTKEDDKAFEDVRRRRKEEEESDGIFDF